MYGTPLIVFFPAVALLVYGVSEGARWFGARQAAKLGPGEAGKDGDVGTLAGAALGILALLLAFSFSIALARYDARREAVLHEANAIGSTANFALLLPPKARPPILALLRRYAGVRVALGVPYGPEKLRRDIATSVELQGQLWSRAAQLAEADPRSLPVSQFVASLNEQGNVHEERITTLRARIPEEVIAMLVAVAVVAMGFVGFHGGLGGRRRVASRAVMAITIAALVVLIVDLDRPARGLIDVSVQPLVDAANGIPR